MGPDTRLGVLPVNAQALVRPSHFLIRAGGIYTRFLLSKWCNSVTVRGMDRFVDLLQQKERITPSRPGAVPRGILTYTNHISVLDDPAIFGAFPKEVLRSSHTTRWTLGASDIMFTSPLLSWLFRSGQVLATDRGRGVFQPSLDRSIDLLEKGGWVHIFPEGYVNMSRKARVRRFKWGIARMLMEAGMTSSLTSSTLNSSEKISNAHTQRPYVVPMWISGLDAIMPEPRGSPRWFPRPGADVTIHIGSPINDELDPVLDAMNDFTRSEDAGKGTESTDATLQESVRHITHLSSSYAIPPQDLFSERTPLQGPPGGVPWPVPLQDSRSAKALAGGLDTGRARAARSFVSAELRAHLVRLGEEAGISKDLAHRLMAEEESH